MGELKSLQQARTYANNPQNVDATRLPQNEQNLILRYAIHDIAKKTGETPTINFDYSPVDYSDTLSVELYKPYVSPLVDVFGGLWNAVPSVLSAFITSPTHLSAGGISLLNDILEKITGDDYDDPKIQAEKKNWFYDPAAKGSIEWTNSVNDFFDSWKWKGSDNANKSLDVRQFFETANPNNVAYTLGSGIGSIFGFMASIAATRGLSGAGFSAKLGSLGSFTKADMVGSFIYMNNEIAQELKKNPNIQPVNAEKLSALISIPVALSEYVGLSLLGKVITKPAQRSAIKGGIEDAVKTYGEKGLTKEMYQDFVAKSVQGINKRLTTAALKATAGATVEGTEELVQGKLQQAGEALYDRVANKKVFGTELFNKESLKEDINNAFWGGTIGGLFGGGGGMINSKEMQQSMFNYIGGNLKTGRVAKIEGLKKFIGQLAENGKLSPEQAKQGIELVDKMVKIHSEEMPVTLTDVNARYQAYDIINQRNEAQKKLDALKERPVDEILSEADSNLKTTLEQTVGAYDNALSLIAKTKGVIDENELGRAIQEIGNQFVQKEAAVHETGTEEKSEQVDGVNEGVNDGVNEVTNQTVTEEVRVSPDEAPQEVKVEPDEKAQLETEKKKYENRLKVMNMAEGKITKSTKLTDEQKNEKLAALEVDRQEANNKIQQINDRLGEIGKTESGNVEVEAAAEGIEIEDTGVSGEVEQVEGGVDGDVLLKDIDKKDENYHSIEEAVKGKKFVRQTVSIDELVEKDKDLQEYLNDNKETKGRKIEKAIIVGDIARGGETQKGGVIDGFHRIAQAIANGETKIEAYVEQALKEQSKEKEVAKKGKKEKKVKGRRKQSSIPSLRNDFYPTTEYEAAIEYLANGGKVKANSLEIPINKETGKKSRIEFASYLWVINNKSMPIDGIAQEIANKYDFLDEMEIEKQLREIISAGKKTLIEDIVRINSQVGGYSQKMMEEQEEYERWVDEEIAIHDALMNKYSDVSDEDYIEISNMASDYVDTLTEEEQKQILTNEKPIIYEEVIAEKQGEDEGDGGITPIGTEEKFLNEKIAEAEEEVRLAVEAYDAKKQEVARGINKEQPQIFGKEKDETKLFDEAADISQQNIDKILADSKARVETAKRRLAELNEPSQREQAKDLDKRQIDAFKKAEQRISLTQSVMRDAMKIDMSKSVDENIKDLEQDGTIKTECE